MSVNNQKGKEKKLGKINLLFVINLFFFFFLLVNFTCEINISISGCLNTSTEKKKGFNKVKMEWNLLFIDWLIVWFYCNT